jgi:putative transposase
LINTREIAVEYRLSHWAGIMQERNASGLSIKAYCESIGLHQNVYHYWQRKLREAACKELLPATVNNGEVAKAPNGWALCESNRHTSSTSGNEVIIEIGKSRVTANTGTDLELLRNICRMLTSL